MKMDWSKFEGKTLNVTMHENFGLTMDPRSNTPIFEIVFKSGKLIGVFDEGLLLEAIRDSQTVNIFIPYQSVKCVEIFNI